MDAKRLSRSPKQITGTVRFATPTDREITITRVFDAPRRQVFDALINPKLLKDWFGPRVWSLVVCQVDLKVGGRWRFVVRGHDGTGMGLQGVYREISPPERLVHTETFDDFPGESIVTTLLVEDRGRTTLTATVQYPSREVRDTMVNSGMEHGASERLNRLSELLGSMARPRKGCRKSLAVNSGTAK